MATTRDLRSAMIRLAHQKPELREHLLPLLKNADTEYPEWFQNNSVWQVRQDKGEIVIWQVQKGSHSQKVKQPKILGEYTSQQAAETEAKKLAPEKKTANVVQDRVNKALAETGIWDMKELAKHLRAKGDEEAAKLLETRDEGNKILHQSPAYKFVNQIGKDIRAEAHGAWIQEPWLLEHPPEGGDEISIYFNSHKAGKPVVILHVEDNGKVKVKKFDKGEWSKLQKLRTRDEELFGPKMDAMAAYLKKHGTHV